MLKLKYLWIAIFFAISANAQASIKVLDKDTNEPLSGATVKFPNKSFIADTAGIVHPAGMANGQYTIEVTYIGYNTQIVNIDLSGSSLTIELFLQKEDEEEEEIIVESTRISRNIR